MPAAATAIPVKPNTAASSATTKNIKAQLSIESPFELTHAVVQSGSNLLRHKIGDPFSATCFQSPARGAAGPQKADPNGGFPPSFFPGHPLPRPPLPFPLPHHPPRPPPHHPHPSP